MLPSPPAFVVLCVAGLRAPREVVGAWVARKFRRDGANHVMLGVVLHAHVNDPQLGGSALESDISVSESEGRFAVGWEDNHIELWSEEEVRAAALPVATDGGIVLVEPVAGAREDEMGVLVRKTAKRLMVRFLPEYKEVKGKKVGEPHCKEVAVQWQTSDGKDYVNLSRATAPAPKTAGAVARALHTLLTARLVEAASAAAPRRAAIATALGRNQLTPEAEAGIVGAPVSYPSRDVVFEGKVAAAKCEKDGLSALVTFEDRNTIGDGLGDTAEFDAVDALRFIDWPRWEAAAAPAPARGDPRASLREPATAAQPGPVMDKCLKCGKTKVAERCDKHPGKGKLFCAGCWAHDEQGCREARRRPPATAVPLDDNCSPARPLPQWGWEAELEAIWAARSAPAPPAGKPGARRPARDAPAPRKAAINAAAIAGVGSWAARHDARHMSQEQFDTLAGRFLEGVDTRFTPEWKATHPRRERTYERAKAFADAAYGKAPHKRRPKKHRWMGEFTAEKSAVLLELSGRFATVKANTYETYRSNRTGYEQFCEAMVPPLEPYPLKAKRVGAWLLARWNRGWVSNPPNTRSLVSSLTWYTVNVLEIFLDVRPYPGMDTIERKRLNRIIIAIGEMEDMALKRSIPLTLTLMRLFLQELRVPLPEYFLTGSGSRGTAAELRNARNIAMFALARACMLRKDDMTKGKLKVGSYRRKAEGEYDGSLLVAPGKAHRSHVFAHVPGCGDRGLSGGWQDLMFPGVAVERWLRLYETAAGGELDAMAPLFPQITSAGRPRAAAFAPKELVKDMQGWARQLGFPPEFVELLTPHGFRSGGATDGINSGKMTPQHLRAQARWSGLTFEMYLHLASDVVRGAVRDAIGHYIDSEAPEDVQYARVVESFMHAAPARDGQEFASAVGGGMARMHANQAGRND